MTSVLELLLADARTPTGGYAHSGGLEAAVAAGLRADDLPCFIHARLRTVARVEAAVAALACACGSVDELLALDVEWAARTASEPLRDASRALGRGLLRTALVWFAEEGLLGSYGSASALTPRPVVLGAVARSGGLDALAAARCSLYDDAAAVAAAAVKLLPLDAAVASGWVLSLRGAIEELAAAAAGSGLVSTSTPLLELRSLVHASTDRRLFVS